MAYKFWEPPVRPHTSSRFDLLHPVKIAYDKAPGISL